MGSCTRTFKFRGIFALLLGFTSSIWVYTLKYNLCSMPACQDMIRNSFKCEVYPLLSFVCEEVDCHEKPTSVLSNCENVQNL